MSETTAQQTPKKKGIPDWAGWVVIVACVAGSAVFGVLLVKAWWLKILLGLAGALVTCLAAYFISDSIMGGPVMTAVTLIFVLGGGALGAFMAQAWWLRILLGLAGALVSGITCGCYCYFSEEAKNRKLAVVMDVCAVAGAALGAFLGHALWQRAVFGLAGALALTLIAYIAGKIVMNHADKKDTSQWLERWNRFSSEEKWDCWQKTVSAKQTKYWPLLSLDDKNTLWSKLTVEQQIAFWPEMGEEDKKAYFPKLTLDQKYACWLKIDEESQKAYWSRLDPEQKDGFRERLIRAGQFKTISQHLGLSHSLLSPDEKDRLWSMMTSEQKCAAWQEMDEENQKAYWPMLTPEQQIACWSKMNAEGQKVFFLKLSPNDKDRFWPMLTTEQKYAAWQQMDKKRQQAYFPKLTPEQKYAAWQQMDKNRQHAYFPKLPFNARMDIVMERADGKIQKEDAGCKTALTKQDEYAAAYNGAFAVDLFFNFQPGAGYGFLDSVESAQQKYEYLRGIGEYCGVVCNASIAIMRYNAALYQRYRAQAVVYCQTITEISSRLSVKEREAFDTAALNYARQVTEIQFSGELPEIAVSQDYVFGSTIEGMFSGMSRREKKQMEKSVTSFFSDKRLSSETKMKAAGAALAIGAAVEIGSVILNKIEQASEAKRQYKEAEAQLIPQINSIVEKKQQADNFSERLRELIDSIDKSIEVYKKIFSDVNDALYPDGDPSKSPEAREAREKPGEAPYFTMDEKQKLMELREVAGYMMKIVDAGI